MLLGGYRPTAFLLTYLLRCILDALVVTVMANMLYSMDSMTAPSTIRGLDLQPARLTRTPPIHYGAWSELVVSWEYEEFTIHRHYGWVPMAPEFSAQLEEAFAIDPTSVIRIKCTEEPSIVWKIDLGQKTQRRLSNGIDQCARRIRRIYLSKDDVGSDGRDA